MGAIVLKCTICGRGEAAKILGVCLSCIRERPEEAWALIKKTTCFVRASCETREMNDRVERGFWSDGGAFEEGDEDWAGETNDSVK